MAIPENILNQTNVFLSALLPNIEKQQVKDERISLSSTSTPKLKYVSNTVPLISIDGVKSVTVTPFGRSEENFDTSKIYVDSNGYISLYSSYSIYSTIFHNQINELLITYTYGYEMPPQDLILAAVMIAQNIARRGTFGATGVVDEDVKLTFLDDSIVTTDIRRLIRKYQGV